MVGIPDPHTFRPEPVDQDAFDVAFEAFRRLDHGARTGEWSDFIELCHPQLTWFAPVDGYQGLHRGRDSIEELFEHHADVTRTHWELKNVLANGSEIAFEAWTSGTIEGKSYGNQLQMLFVIDDGVVRHIREYAGYINGVGDFVGHGDPDDGAEAHDYRA